MMAGLLLATAAALVRVFVGTDALRLGYALSEQQGRHRVLVGRQRELQASLAEATAPARLAQLGARWGLAPPAPEQIVIGPAALAPPPAAAAAE